jgi:uncharacterized protein YraI
VVSPSEDTPSPSPAGPEDNGVILVHGIRTYALWQSEIRTTLKKAGFVTAPTNYGRFNVFQFLAPIPFFRQWAIKQVWEQIKIVKANYPSKRFSIIAHSFGTYVVANLVKRNFDLNANRIIFCGSIVSYRFRFQDYKGRFTGQILNDVGTRDIWPAMAQSVTWGYGSTGSYGFNRPDVYDRWHNRAKHGFFLNPQFCKTYWIPFLKDGTIVDPPEEPEKPVILLRTLGILRIKYLLVAILAAWIWVALPFATPTVYSVASRARDLIVGPDETRPWQTWPWPKPEAACLPPGQKLPIASCSNPDGLYVVAEVPWHDRDHGLVVRSTPAIEERNQVYLLPPNMTEVAVGQCDRQADGSEWCRLHCKSKNKTGWANKRYLKLRSDLQYKSVGPWEFSIRNGPGDDCPQIETIPNNAAHFIKHFCHPFQKWCLITYKQSSGWVHQEDILPE